MNLMKKRMENVMEVNAKKKVKVGDKFNLLEVTKDNGIVWLCKCDCGRAVRATTIELTNGRIKSCCYCGWGK